MTASSPQRVDSLDPRGWRETLGNGRDAIRHAFDGKVATRSLLMRYRRLVDEVLQSLWTAVRLPATASLVAVGGYGRGELFPHSDVDVLILLQANPDAATQTAIEHLVGLFWDIGLEVGHSVRTVAECLEEARRDVTVQTNLLEARYLCGERSLYRHFEQMFRAELDPHVFFEAKLLEQDQRHARFNDSAYSLEPNLKESPGGLRDLHNLLWLAQAAGIGRRWSDLAEAGLLNAGEMRQIQALERFLFGLRFRLHYLAGRREDRLLFDYQNALAAQYGISATATRRASELLMQRYYRSAKIVAQMRDILIPGLRARVFAALAELPPTALNARFQVRGNLLEAVDERVFEREPGTILECFHLLQRRPELQGMTAGTLRALWRARERINPVFRRDPANRARFMAILREPRGLTWALRSMNRYGVLGRYIPAFGRVVGQMQHDLFHIYTVDEHILTVLRNMRRLNVPELAHEYPLASRLISGFERPEVLYLAALFHDIAKGRGGDHSTLGAVDARRFCRQHGLTAQDVELVGWLVSQHLSMSATAQKQDLSDADVIAGFAGRVPDERHLIALYLLTVCDIRGTSPKVWNAWKGKLLEDLFYATRRVLGSDSPQPGGIAAVKAEAQRILRLYGLEADAQDILWGNLDDSYFLRHEAQEIAWHTRLLWHSTASAKALVRARLSPIGEGVQVMIYAPDREELFARICGFFERLNYTILDAKIHTTRNGHALDSFMVMDEAQRKVPYRDFLSYIEHELMLVLHARSVLQPSGHGRISRHLRHFPITPEITLRPDEKGAFHMLGIVAGDRPGLLSAIAQVLHQHHVRINAAKITTLGERAEDTFMIQGAVLTRQKSLMQLETDLLAVLKT
ncbi:bifunctional uridylyltransferase/uridylyl-removing enzyme [Sulfuriferula plumbiphila]|uniref:Bifunctional uridylyltransferase/uridylyl-removing enzyme n=1 Tax=Sulfuriferula plumbiphila TaxID=171865 RepID=A0A512L5U3_9PROT|nr:[protein-PII] uridylyltransferase [Sulfuriferula plumbiphila]BBP05088.1 bifunctional uridylyltransferase/uridylyl-removing enzyme [Sulfuriferula plumbiphila]GEP29834.1 bifunctional uridylyltransferase/uridylyl-removing enzyme [Sulfuriferula plumbiphila]